MVSVLPALPEIGKVVSNVVVDHNFLLLFCFYFSAFCFFAKFDIADHLLFLDCLSS